MAKSKIPEVYRRWAAISAVAGALARKAWYDFGAFQVYPNMFIILVGEPGIGKSVSLDIPFEKIFKALSVPVFMNVRSDPDATHEYSLHQMEQPLRYIQDKITPEQLAVDLQSICHADVSHSTFEKTAYRAELTLITSEFGVLMDRNNKNLQVFLTDIWDGKPEIWYRTKTAGQFYIQGGFLNWIAGATPGQFVDNMPESAQSQGLLSRLLPIWYEGPRLPQKLRFPKPDKRILEELKQDLADIASIYGEFEWATPGLMLEAEEWLEHGERPTEPTMKEYCERRGAHLMKLLIVVSASRSSDRIISPEDWVYARDTLLQAEKEMPHALRLFGSTQLGRTSVELTDMVQSVFNTNKVGMSLRAFKQAILRRVHNASEVNNLVDTMQGAGLIRVDLEAGHVEPADFEPSGLPHSQESKEAQVGYFPPIVRVDA